MTAQSKVRLSPKYAKGANDGHLRALNEIDPNKLHEIVEMALREGIVDDKERDALGEVILDLSFEADQQLLQGR